MKVRIDSKTWTEYASSPKTPARITQTLAPMNQFSVLQKEQALSVPELRRLSW